MFRWQMGPLMDPDPAPGGGDPPAFDWAKERKQLIDDFNKTLNGILAKERKQKEPPADPVDPPADPPDPKAKDDKTAKELAKLRDEVKAEREKREASEKRGAEERRLSLIRTEIAKHQLNEHAGDDAFRFFRDGVKQLEDGSLVGGPDDEPLADFVKKTVEAKPHWLPPKSVGGAGAGNGRGGKQQLFDDSQIKPGMSTADKQAAMEAIRAAIVGH